MSYTHKSAICRRLKDNLMCWSTCWISQNSPKKSEVRGLIPLSYTKKNYRHAMFGKDLSDKTGSNIFSCKGVSERDTVNHSSKSIYKDVNCTMIAFGRRKMSEQVHSNTFLLRQGLYQLVSSMSSIQYASAKAELGAHVSGILRYLCPLFDYRMRFHRLHLTVPNGIWTAMGLHPVYSLFR